MTASPVAASSPISSMLSRRIKLAITCRFLISIDSAVNASLNSAHRIHLCNSSHVSATAAEVIAPSPTCLGLISRRGVRIGIGMSISIGFEGAILNNVSERQEQSPSPQGAIPDRFQSLLVWIGIARMRDSDLVIGVNGMAPGERHFGHVATHAVLFCHGT